MFNVCHFFCHFRQPREKERKNVGKFHKHLLPKLIWHLHKICHSIFGSSPSNYYIKLSTFCSHQKTIHGHKCTKYGKTKHKTENQSGNDDNLNYVVTKMDLNCGILRRSWSLKIYVFIVLYMQFCCLKEHRFFSAMPTKRRCDFARCQGRKRTS